MLSCESDEGTRPSLLSDEPAKRRPFGVGERAALYKPSEPRLCDESGRPGAWWHAAAAASECGDAAAVVLDERITGLPPTLRSAGAVACGDAPPAPAAVAAFCGR